MLIGIPVAIIEAFWFLPLYFRRGKIDTVSPEYVILTAILGMSLGLLGGVLFTILGAALLQHVLMLDKNSLLYAMLDCIIAVGFGEELSKFLCGNIFLKKSGAKTRLDYIYIMGAAGLGFAFTETITYAGGSLSILIRILFPLHIMFQLHMGAHYFEYKKAKLNGLKADALKEAFLGFWVPVLLHAAFDFVAVYLFSDLATAYADNPDAEITAAQIIAIIAGTAFELSMIVYSIITERWAFRELRKERQTQALNTAESPDAV